MANILSWKYVNSLDCIEYHAGFYIGQRLLSRLKKKYAEDIIYGLTKFIQKLSKSVFDSIIEDGKNKKLDIVEISAKYDIPKDRLKSLYQRLNIDYRKGRYGGRRGKTYKETYIEKWVRNVLECELIQFEQEKPVGKYTVDFVMGNICIEVNGDYWHGNPRLFPEPDKRQKQKIRIDAEKKVIP